MSGTEAMLPDAAAPALPPLDAPAPRATGAKAASLTRRASLTAVASLLDYVVKAAVQLVITPILVGGLGRTLYGVWEMLSRLTGYMSATDGRPTEALRLLISRHQSPADAPLRRQYIGAAVAVWLLMLPLVLLVGVLLVFVAVPLLVHLPPAQLAQAQRAAALLAGAFVATGLGNVPESALRGMNLGYKRMGVQASLHVLGGAFAAVAVWEGLGLTGIGGSVVLRGALTGLVYFALARRHVPGFGAARPVRRDLKTVFGMSVWLSAGDIIAKLLLASDVLVLGAIAGPAVVTPYALTAYAARTAVGVHVFTAGAAIPGIGGLLGSGQHARAAQARRELLLLTWLFATVAGTTILAWNHAFLSLWVGPRLYAGTLVNLLIVATAAQTAFIRTDSYVLDAALKPKQRVMIGAGAAALTLAACYVLTRLYGVPGLCAGVLVGRAVQTIGYPRLVERCLEDGAGPRGGDGLVLRLFGTTAVLYLLAVLAGARIGTPGWPVWIAGVVATVPAVTGVALLAGPDAATRRRLVRRLVALAHLRRAP